MLGTDETAPRKMLQMCSSYVEVTALLLSDQSLSAEHTCNFCCGSFTWYKAPKESVPEQTSVVQMRLP